jgi:peptidoglycan/LPS O-acetylase OafA/YrhL
VTARAAPPADAFHMPSLDGIRTFSFLVVFLAHAGLDAFVPGGFGVTVFFFLSGFLITTLLRLEYDRHGDVSFRQFYLRRVLRILPPFYLVLAASVAAASFRVVPGGLQWPAVVAQACHFANYRIVLHGYRGMPAGTGVYWSLAVEEHFYLVFPWLYLALRRSGAAPLRQATILWAICGAVFAWRCVLVYGLHTMTDRTYVASDTRVDSILFGCALAVYGNPVLDGQSSVSDRTWKLIFLPLSALLLGVTFLYRPPAFRETLRYSLQGVALYPLFIAAVRFPTWGPFRILNLRLVAFLGVLSYSLYLVHHVVIDALEMHVPLPAIARGPLALAISIGIAWGIYRVVERPCANLRKRLSRTITGGASSPGKWSPKAVAT